MIFFCVIFVLFNVFNYLYTVGFPDGSSGKEPACQCRKQTQLPSLDWEDPLEKEMEALSSILAWRIPWTEEPGRLWSIESHKVRHN